MMTRNLFPLLFAGLVAVSASACFSSPPEGLARAKPAKTTVRMDMFHRPLPEIPLPNDIATRHDATSATGRRINASMIAPTAMERRVRGHIDQLDGWGTLQPIGIPFTGPLSIKSILEAHSDERYALADDVVYLVNVDRASKNFGKLHHLDVGNGNYPVVLEKMGQYWKNDPRGNTITLGFEEYDEDPENTGKIQLGEDINGNGILDPGEDVNGNGILDPPNDTDADGLLDKPNYLPGARPDPNDLAARADATMTFYEKQTNTLILRALEPLDERTTYAVVVTRRLRDADGAPVGSPYPFVNHTSQTEALKPLLDVMPEGLELDDVAFAFTFTTQSAQAEYQAVRDGLYGHGVQKHLAEEFPAKLNELMPMRDEKRFPGMKRPHLVHAEQWKDVFKEVATSPVLGMKADSEAFKAAYDSLDYIDYFVVGSYDSPQLFNRWDEDGKWLPFDDQSWPKDLHGKKAQARSETVYFTLSVPRKEVSVRKEGKQAPVVLLGHGYGSTRFEGMQMAGYFARHGIATLSIDAPGHGISLSEIERAAVTAVFKQKGMAAAADALMSARALNQDSDPWDSVDSGVDFWTAYLFHTRDVVRQYVLDTMQAVRILRSFDGREWQFDVNGDGSSKIAGDFDGDGIIDVGAESKLSVVGASLGGMLSMLVGSLEPEVDVSVPIAGGGGFADMGIRTTQSGAYEGFILRAMGPLYAGTVEFGEDGTGEMLVETIVPYMNKKTERKLAKVPGVRAWDAMIVENLENGSRGCGYVNERGQVRANLESDLGDRTRITVYAGPQLAGDTKCGLREGAENRKRKVIDTFELPGEFLGSPDTPPTAWEIGAPLVALADGLGLPRAHPDLRRFQGLGQLVLDGTDPATFAKHMLRQPLAYPGTKQETGSHALVVTTLGDLSVPANTGVTFCRAAGLVDYLNDDPRFGKPMNQVLIDNYVPEAVHTLKRHVDSNGEGVHIDVHNFSQGTDLWDVPRLATPIHDFGKSDDALGGKSACIFPLADPQGRHGFAYPGEERDSARKKAGCGLACDPDPELTADDTCSCKSRPFDTGYFMFNMIANYIATEGKVLSEDLCMSKDECEGWPARPEMRSGAAIDE